MFDLEGICKDSRAKVSAKVVKCFSQVGESEFVFNPNEALATNNITHFFAEGGREVERY